MSINLESVFREGLSRFPESVRDEVRRFCGDGPTGSWGERLERLELAGAMLEGGQESAPAAEPAAGTATQPAAASSNAPARRPLDPKNPPSWTSVLKYPHARRYWR